MKKTLFLLLIFSLYLAPFSYADENLEFESYNDFPITETATNSITKEPQILSKNAIIYDRNSKITLYEKNIFEEVPIASTTKIMTCILALENANLNDIVVISKKAASVTGSTLGLKESMKISLQDLLYGLMLRSGNDCALAISEHISGSTEKFADLMNKKAKELNLDHTNFVTPHGLDNENHYSTAYDLALLTDYALTNELFKKIVSTPKITINFNGYPKELHNTNELLGYTNGVYGVKTGFTFKAGRCLVSACKRNEMDIIVVVLGANTKSIRTHDSKNLISYAFSTFKYVDISSEIQKSFNFYIDLLRKDFNLYKTTSFPILKLEKINTNKFPILSSNSSPNLNTKIYLLNKFSSYTPPNTVIGKLEVYNDKKRLCTLDILQTNQLIHNDWKFYFKKIFSYKYF